MSINYNPHNNSHFLLLQDYFPAVVNWLKLRSYICSVSECVGGVLGKSTVNQRSTPAKAAIYPLCSPPITRLSAQQPGPCPAQLFMAFRGRQKHSCFLPSSPPLLMQRNKRVKRMATHPFLPLHFSIVHLLDYSGLLQL